MLKTILSFVISCSLILSGCSTKYDTVHTDESKIEIVNINKFFTDKEHKYYLFFDHQYTYLIDNKNDVININNIFFIAKTFNHYQILQTERYPHIELLDDHLAKVEVYVVVASPAEKNKRYLEILNFVYDSQSKTYSRLFQFTTKFARTSEELKEKYDMSHLKDTIKFYREDTRKYKDEAVAKLKKTADDGEDESEVLKTVVWIPLVVFTFAVILAGGILITPFTGKYPD